MNYLIITGPYRSGTTLVQKLLDVHPRMAIISQGVQPYFKLLESIYFMKKGYHSFDRPLGCKYFEPDTDYLNIFNTDFTDKDIFKVFKKVEADIQDEASLYIGKVYPNIQWCEYLRKILTPGPAKQVLEQIFCAVRLYRKGKLIDWCGFKELNLEQFIEPLLNAFGDKLKVIHLLRDPRAVLASRDFGKYMNIRRKGRKHSILAVACVWRNSVRCKCRLSKKFPNNFFTVCYERVIENPEEEVKGLCAFLNVKFRPRMINPSYYKDDDGKPWIQNTSFKPVSGFAVSSINQWRKVLPKAEIEVLEYLCWHEMLRENYRPVSDEQKCFKALLDYQEDKGEFPSWITESGLILDEEKKQDEIKRHKELSKGKSR